MKTLTVPGGGGGGEGGKGSGRRKSSVGLAGQRKASTSSGGAQGGQAGPSLIGLLASKRLAKKFASRFHSRRFGRLSGQGIPIQKEPSYRMQPHNKFQAEKVEVVIRTQLEDKLGKFRYSPKICANMTKILADDIKAKVKALNFDRYKLVCHVVIGQKKDQAVMTCSRCAWDDKLDNYASYTFQNAHIFCTASVFGIYTE
ncbi:dynein light chain Tctex-type protein 2B-like isoform X2 [Littorina saxatilis]